MENQDVVTGSTPFASGGTGEPGFPPPRFDDQLDVAKARVAVARSKHVAAIAAEVAAKDAHDHAIADRQAAQEARDSAVQTMRALLDQA